MQEFYARLERTHEQNGFFIYTAYRPREGDNLGGKIDPLCLLCEHCDKSLLSYFSKQCREHSGKLKESFEDFYFRGTILRSRKMIRELGASVGTSSL